MKNNSLTPRQINAVRCILENNSIEEAARRAKVSRSTIYNWLRDDSFRSLLEEARIVAFKSGLDALKGATSKAARVLIGLLDSNSEKELRLVAREIINMAIKAFETQELVQRISEIEDHLDRR